MIRWPNEMNPANANLFGHNEVETDLTPEAIWPWLVRATRWHELYSNCKRLRFHEGRGPDLALGTSFAWWTFGVPVETVVEDLVVGERLGWRGTGLGARGYHAWALERHQGRTRFVTEEAQFGIAPRVLRFALQPALLAAHQRWLEGLLRAARAGHPDHVKEIS